MEKLLLIVVVISFTHVVYGQLQKSLSSRLWAEIEGCYSMFDEETLDLLIDGQFSVNS
jgi:hypothetical protein